MLVAMVSAAPASAAVATGCATFGSSFAAQQITGGGVGLRLGCARDAGSLRPLAGGDDDLVAAIDADVTDRPDQWRQVIEQVAATTRTDMARGLTLSQALTLRAQRDSTGYYAKADDETFGGTVTAVGDSLVIVVPAGDVSTAGFWDGWKKLVTGLVVLGVVTAVGGLCLLAFNVGAPAALRCAVPWPPAWPRESVNWSVPAWTASLSTRTCGATRSAPP